MPNILVERLKNLPRCDRETVVGGIVDVPIPRTMVEQLDLDPEDPKLPLSFSACLWCSRSTHDYVASEDELETMNVVECALQTLVKFCEDKKFAGYRPAVIEVKGAMLADALRDLLADAEIDVREVDETPEVDQILDRMQEFAKHVTPHLGDDGEFPSLISGEGIRTTIEDVAAFARAAKSLYLSEPWKLLKVDEIIRTVSPQIHPTLKYLTVMGQNQEELTLSFFQSLEEFENIDESELEEDLFCDINMWAITGCSFDHLPPPDRSLWEAHDFPVAGPNAFPLLVGLVDGRRVIRPTQRILRDLTAILEGIARTTAEQYRNGSWGVECPRAGKSIRLRFESSEVFGVPSAPLFENPILTGLKGDEVEGADDTVLQADDWPDVPPQFLNEMAIRRAEQFLSQYGDLDADAIQELLNREFVNTPVEETPGAPVTAEDMAQELMYQAYGARSISERIRKANRALELWPDCADAHIVLGDCSPTLAMALDHYTRAIEAGERALGRDVIEEFAGELWNLTLARPYMRALSAKADALSRSDNVDRAEIIRLECELLRLNENDNQGVRHDLLPRLICAGRLKEARELVSQYDDDCTAVWSYMRSLLTFECDGDSNSSASALRLAMRTNRFVPRYVLGRKRLPKELPEYYQIGQESEAITFAYRIAEAWFAVPGAIAWLEERHRAATAPKKKSSNKRRKGKGRSKGRRR